MRGLEHRIPPPAIDLACALLMAWLPTLWPAGQLWPRGGNGWAWALAAAWGLAGAAIALAGVREFRRARTTANPMAPQRTRVLVTSGIYRLSRNPMYLGMLLVLTGWAVWLGHVLPFAVLPLSVWLLNELQIKPEERILRQRFGTHFERYAARVRRWM